MKINVTARDIRYGKRVSNGSPCPVERAIGRHFPHRDVHVGASLAHVHEDKNTRSHRAELPADICGWIVAFDSGEHVEPVTFELAFEQLGGSN